MSWSIIVPAGDYSVFADAADAAVDEAIKTRTDEFKSDEVMDQVRASVAAAKMIVGYRAVGDAQVVVMLSGHANEGHKPVEGMSSDFVTLLVSYSDGETVDAPEGQQAAPVEEEKPEGEEEDEKPVRRSRRRS